MKYIQLIRDLFALVCAVYIVGLVLAGIVKALRHLAIAIDTNDTTFSLVLLAVGGMCYLWLWSKEVM